MVSQHIKNLFKKQSKVRKQVKPLSQLVVRVSTDGLWANLNENLARHASAPYDFGRTYASKHFHLCRSV